MITTSFLMAIDLGLIDWSRAQFALTACYHWLFVPLTLGLAVIMAVAESIYYVKKDAFWKQTAMFWQKLFGINFAIGVATGIILEFQFGTNWSNYSWIVGDIFGAPLAIEGIVAFFMEATFIAVIFFGWNKVSRGFHLASTILTGVGATLSAWWILVANSWMQHPVGMVFNLDTVRNEMVDFCAIAFSGEAITKFFHTVMSGWMTGAVFAIGVSSWYLLKKRNIEFAIQSIKLAVSVGVVATLFTMASGDMSGVDVAKNQPMKFAAIEGLHKGGEGVAFSIMPGVEVPNMLSFLATRDFNGFVPGVEDILYSGYPSLMGEFEISAIEKMSQGKEALDAFADYRRYKDTCPDSATIARQRFEAHVPYFGYGYINQPEDLIPPLHLTYWSFRIMVGCGFYIFLIVCLNAYFIVKKRLHEAKWLHYATISAVPFVYLAGQCGWIVAEVGRQPWAIQDLLPVGVAISQIPVSAVMTTFCVFALLFTLLLIIEIRIMCKAIAGFEFNLNK